MLVAMFAIGALASASASAALPEFKSGYKFPIPFTAKSNSVTLNIKGGGAYLCKTSTTTGEITGPKEVAKVIIKFNGENGCSGFCKQPVHEGWWETKELKGRIGYLNKGFRTVGLLLEGTVEPFAKCNTPLFGGPEKLIGAIIGELSPTNTGTTSFALTYKQGVERGQQQITHFEGEEALHNLETIKSPGAAGIKTSVELQEDKVTTAKEVQIVA